MTQSDFNLIIALFLFDNYYFYNGYIIIIIIIIMAIHRGDAAAVGATLPAVPD